MSEEAVQAAIELLDHSRSPKRRSGARRLRKLGDPSAGPTLIKALKREVLDPRTWETQYQMIMALGECRFTAATPLFRGLATQTLEATMLYIALGDALVRLGHAEDRAHEVLLELLRSGNLDLADGGVRAVAMTRLRPSGETIEAILKHVAVLPKDEGQGPNRWFWVAAASPGWLDLSPRVRPFLKEALSSSDQQLCRAAEAALSGKYLTWKPL